MHAVLVKVSISDFEGSVEELRETVVPRISSRQGRGEPEDASRPSRVGFDPPAVGPPSGIERMYARSRDARRIPVRDRDARAQAQVRKAGSRRRLSG